MWVEVEIKPDGDDPAESEWVNLHHFGRIYTSDTWDFGVLSGPDGQRSIYITQRSYRAVIEAITASPTVYLPTRELD